MDQIADKFKINLNQNLWGILASFSFLGISEFFELCVLFWFSATLSLTMLISICITTFAYTRKYASDKNK